MTPWSSHFGTDYLVRNVLPAVPLRQWVLSFPRRVRFLAARHPGLASWLLAVFTRAVFAWQRRVARRRVGDPRPEASLRFSAPEAPSI